jgi:hypothetical protein
MDRINGIGLEDHEVIPNAIRNLCIEHLSLPMKVQFQSTSKGFFTAAKNAAVQNDKIKSNRRKI